MAAWLITWQVKQTLRYVNEGAVEGLLINNVSGVTFSLLSQRSKEVKKNNSWSQVRGTNEMASKWCYKNQN